ncbi:MAG: hypothetical protein WCJ81_02745 [bacterium]
MIPAISAAFFRVVSIDFLLPYSLLPAAHPIPRPRPPLGLMRRTEITNTIPLRIRRSTNSVFMNEYVESKCKQV